MMLILDQFRRRPNSNSPEQIEFAGEINDFDCRHVAPAPKPSAAIVRPDAHFSLGRRLNPLARKVVGPAGEKNGRENGLATGRRRRNDRI